MGRQRNIPNKRTKQTPEKELNKMETSNFLDAELKILVIRNLKLRGRVEKLRTLPLIA